MLLYQLIQYARFLHRYHSQRLMAALVGAIVLLIAALQAGSGKQVIHWMDVAGEGAAALLALSWLLLLLCARPPGRVTYQLYAGALLYWFACLLDVIDEFVHYPAGFRLFADIESLAIPTAMLLVTLGLWEWLQEQKLINRQLKQREMIHRDYHLLDPLTQLYGEAYLARQMQHLAERQQPVACELVMFELESEAASTARCSQSQLAAFSELVLANIQSDDVLCRCGGQRFALLFTNISSSQAKAQFASLMADAQQRVPADIRWLHRAWHGQQQVNEFIASVEDELQLKGQMGKAKQPLKRGSTSC